MLSVLLFSHLGELTLWNRRLLVPLLKPLMRQEVLSHDTRDLLEVIQDCKACIFYLLLRWAEPAEFVV